MISNEGNKIFSFYQDAKKLIKGDIVFPRFVSLWLTTTCDLSCSYCFFNKNNKEKMIASTNKVLKLIDELVEIGVESLEFSGGGEPTLHPDCFNIAEYACKKGLKVGLLTNGFRFDLTKLKYFSYIRIGLDATEKEVYSKLKGSKEDRFERTLENIREILLFRGADTKPRVGLKFMLNSKNYLNILGMINLSKELKVDYCHFKGTHSDADKLSTMEELSVERAIISLKSIYDNFVYGSVCRENPSVKCFMSPIHTVITPKGDCLVCCYFNDKEHIIGNVFEQGFSSVWASKRHKQIMGSINILDCQKVQCRWHKYNTEMSDILIKDKYELSFI